MVYHLLENQNSLYKASGKIMQQELHHSTLITKYSKDKIQALHKQFYCFTQFKCSGGHSLP